MVVWELMQELAKHPAGAEVRICSSHDDMALVVDHITTTDPITVEDRNDPCYVSEYIVHIVRDDAGWAE